MGKINFFQSQLITQNMINKHCLVNKYHSKLESIMGTINFFQSQLITQYIIHKHCLVNKYHSNLESNTITMSIS